MQSRFEVFIKCPIKGSTVSTGYVVSGPEFKPDEKPTGVFNCPSCGQAHLWNTEQAQILEVFG